MSLSFRVAVALAALLMVGIAGCSLVLGSDVSHTRPRADRIAIVLSRTRQAPATERLGLATDHEDTHDVVVLVAEDDAEGNASRMVLRITEIHDNGPWRDADRWSACWEYRFASWGVDAPTHVSCPDAEPIAPPPATDPGPILPGPDQDVVLSTLRALTPAEQADVARVDADLRTAFAANPAVTVRVIRSGTTTGVAVAQTGTLECVLARTPPMEAWVPAKVYVQPGEAGCTAFDAASGNLKHPPH